MKERARVLTVAAPCSGRVLPLSKVPDPVFSQAMMGPGVAVDPRTDSSGERTVVAPIAGTVAKAHPHAILITDDAETGTFGVLVHLGINTVKLNGAGFTRLVEEGEAVAVGDPLTRWDPSALPALADQAGLDRSEISAVSPVIALEQSAENLRVSDAADVTAGALLFTL